MSDTVSLAGQPGSVSGQEAAERAELERLGAEVNELRARTLRLRLLRPGGVGLAGEHRSPAR